MLVPVVVWYKEVSSLVLTQLPSPDYADSPLLVKVGHTHNELVRQSGAQEDVPSPGLENSLLQ